jgi:hypothetical protein
MIIIINKFANQRAAFLLRPSSGCYNFAAERGAFILGLAYGADQVVGVSVRVFIYGMAALRIDEIDNHYQFGRYYHS